MEAFFVSTGVVALAEVGDKTQLLAFLLAARFKKPLPIIAGILVATNFETGKTTFELNEGGHHDHLVCLSCGEVVEFHDEDIESKQEKIAKKHGFKLINHSMSLYGLCSKPECRESTQ